MRCISILVAFVCLLQAAHAQDRWVAVNDGLTDLKVLSIAVDGEDRLFAGTDTGKVFKSVNGGLSWSDVTNGLDLARVSKIAVSPDDNLYATLWEYVVVLEHYVYRSTDQGQNWTFIDDGLPAEFFPRSLEIDPNGVPYLGGFPIELSLDFLYRFSETNMRWEPVNTYYGNSPVAIEFTESGDIYLGDGGALGGNRVAVSKDGGETYFALGAIPGPGTGVHVLHVDFDGYLFAQGDMGPYRLNGEWIPVYQDLPEAQLMFIESRPHPFTDTFAGMDGHGIYRTTNHGDAWTPINQGLTDFNVRELVVDSTGTLFCATDGGGVFRSTNLVPVELSEFSVD